MCAGIIIVHMSEKKEFHGPVCEVVKGVGVVAVVALPFILDAVVVGRGIDAVTDPSVYVINAAVLGCLVIVCTYWMQSRI